MGIEDKEKLIREQRTIEATKKNLMGLGGKLGCILRNLGQPIIGQYDEGRLFSTTNVDPINGETLDPFDELEEDYIKHMGMGGMPEPTGDEWGDRDYDIPDTHTVMYGWHWDGLSQGYH